MPRLIRPVPQFSVQREGLVDHLAKELGSPCKFGQPIIIEDPVAGGDRRLIHVIWDDWEGCPREERTAIIQAAYQRAFGEEYQDKISLAIGITVPEAVAMGLLPYTFRKRQSHGEWTEEERQAMIKAGASILLDPRRPELRCATEDDADATYQFLHQRLPNTWWIIVEEAQPTGD